MELTLTLATTLIPTRPTNAWYRVTFLLVRVRREVVEVCLIYTCVIPSPLYEALDDQTDIRGLLIARKETGSTYYYSIGTH